MGNLKSNPLIVTVNLDRWGGVGGGKVIFYHELLYVVCFIITHFMYKILHGRDKKRFAPVPLHCTDQTNCTPILIPFQY